MFLLAAAAVCPARSESLTLADCLRETAEHNPAIQTQREAIRVSLGTRLVLRSRALPKLSVSGIAGEQGSQGVTIIKSRPVTVAPGMTVQPADTRVERAARFFTLGSGLLSQPLFDAAIPASWRRGNLDVAIAEQNFAAVASVQLHAARQQYYTAVFQRELGALFGQISGRLEENAKTVGALANAGLAGQQASLQARVQVANYGPPVLSAQGSYRAAVTELLRIMGRDLGRANAVSSVSLADPLADTAPPAIPPGAAAAALARRPDLEALRDLVRAGREDSRIVRAGYYPRLQLYLSGDIIPQNLVRSDRPNALRPGDDIRTTEGREGVRYDWTIIDTGAVAGTAQRSDRSTESTEIVLANAEREVARTLAVLRAQHDSLAAQFEALGTIAATSEETLNIVAASVAQGTASQLDFINAQTELLNTRVSLLIARLQASLARAEFDRVTGGYLRYVPAAGDAGGARAAAKPTAIPAK